MLNFTIDPTKRAVVLIAPVDASLPQLSREIAAFSREGEFMMPRDPWSVLCSGSGFSASWERKDRQVISIELNDVEIERVIDFRRAATQDQLALALVQDARIDFYQRARVLSWDDWGESASVVLGVLI